VSRDIAIIVSCDFCGEPGVAHTVTLDTLGALDIDTCEIHDKEAGLADLRAALSTYGRPEGRKVRKARTGTGTGHSPKSHAVQPCPWCGERGTDIVKHARALHGLMERSTWPCPLDGRVFDALQGLALHANRAHQAYWTSLIIEARTKGDPLGVVADYDASATGVTTRPRAKG
jgi:ribosomal protein L32